MLQFKIMTLSNSQETRLLQLRDKIHLKVNKEKNCRRAKFKRYGGVRSS